MRHLRADYDAIQPWPVKRPHNVKHHGALIMGFVAGDLTDEDLTALEVKPLIPDDEPVFLLRGQDPAAADTVRDYADNALAAGMDLETVQRIRQWADEMELYAETKAHGAPDVPEGLLR